MVLPKNRILLGFAGMAFLLLLGCQTRQSDTKSIPESTRLYGISLKLPFQIEHFKMIPWQGENGLESQLEVGEPRSNQGQSPGKVAANLRRAELRLKTNPPGSILILTPENLLLTLNEQGQETARFILPKPKGTFHSIKIQDFYQDSLGNSYFLETIRQESRNEPGTSLLRKFGPKGQMQWKKRIAFDLKKARYQARHQQILVQGPDLYLSQTGEFTEILKIDINSGEISPFTKLPEKQFDVFADGQGRFYYVSFNPKTRAKTWVQFDPETNQIHENKVDRDLDSYLSLPQSTDPEGNGYFVYGKRMVCTNQEGREKWKAGFDNMTVSKTGKVMYSLFEGKELHVYQSLNGESREMLVKGAFEWKEKNGVNIWLLMDEKEGKWVFQGYNLAKNQFVLTDFDPETEKFLGEPYPQAEESRLFQLLGATKWGITSKGQAIVPVLGPDKLHLLRLTF